MGLREEIIAVKATANDVKRELLQQAGDKLFFLKRAGETGRRFTIVYEPAAGWAVRYSDWRQQLVLTYATASEDFVDIAAQTSFWAYGVGRVVTGVTGLVYDVYGVDPARRDVVPPTTNNPFWKFFLTRIPEERFILEP